MRKYPLLLTFALTALVLGGCRDASDDAANENTTPTTFSTTETDTSATTSNDTEATLPLVSTDEIKTEPSTTIAGADESDTESTTFSQKPSDAEEHGEDPYPTYFTYQFGEDTIGVRLSGGNYQVLHIDLTDASDRNLDFLYRLEDCNFDGHPDFIVPTHFGSTNVSYAVFIWNQDEILFNDKPIMMLNPTVHPEKKSIVSTYEESASVQSTEVYTWANGELMLQTKYTADFAACTLTTTQMDGENALSPETQNYATKDALEAAFQALQ